MIELLVIMNQEMLYEYLEYLNTITDVGRIEFFKTMGVYSDDQTLEKKLFF